MTIRSSCQSRQKGRYQGFDQYRLAAEILSQRTLCIGGSKTKAGRDVSVWLCFTLIPLFVYVCLLNETSLRVDQDWDKILKRLGSSQELNSKLISKTDSHAFKGISGCGIRLWDMARLTE